MSDLLQERVPRMPPMSISAIEQVGEKVLEELYPEALKRPTRIDFVDLVDRVLPAYGVFVYPASAVELADRLAATDPGGTREITILLNAELWHDLAVGGRLAHRARGTVGHELAHAVLHVPIIRRRLASPLGGHLLNRVKRESLRPFEDPEWQAWALGGCVIAPRKTLEMIPPCSIAELARVYGVSESLMLSHIKRLRLQRRFHP